MNPELDRLIQRYRKTEAEHRARVSQRLPIRTTSAVRRSFLGHRAGALSIRFDYPGVKPRSEAEIAWRIGTVLRWMIETAIAQMRDSVDRQLLQDRNLYKFGSELTPVSTWLEQGQYQKVLDWGVRADLYSYRRREGGGDEFKRLVRDRKLDPALLKRKLSFYRTGDPERPLRREENGHSWDIRVNGFPDEPLYTLLIDGVETADFDNWPKPWRREVNSNPLDSVSSD